MLILAGDVSRYISDSYRAIERNLRINERERERRLLFHGGSRNKCQGEQMQQ